MSDRARLEKAVAEGTERELDAAASFTAVKAWQ
jgi:hypothetical protein